MKYEERTNKMKHIVFSQNEPLTYLSCGQLVRDRNFLHPRRCIDSYVLIVVVKGSLYIAQDKTKYIVSDNQYIILRSNTLHYGYASSTEYLQYYWTHFYVPEGTCYCDNDMMASECDVDGNYIIPEYGDLKYSKRVQLLFSQLLDESFRKSQVKSKFMDYFLTCLLMELSGEFIEQENKDISEEISNIKNWIRSNYNQSITVAKIAELFHYNPDYLSNMFKKTAHISLKKYINEIRINEAKNILVSTSYSLKEIAFQCAFNDEKYFLKVFKQIEGVTPTEYKKAFFKKKNV